MNRFVGRTVMVTGGSRGLGRTLCGAFADEGASVVVGYRRREADAQAAVDAIVAKGGAAKAVRIDVTDAATVRSAIADATAFTHLPDVLVNNAGVHADNPFPMMTDEDWHTVVSTNLDGTFRCCREVIRPMMARRAGVIVNVVSVAGFRAVPGQTNYGASKAGIMALTATLAREVGRYGIRVNAIAPGLIGEGMGEKLSRNRVDEIVGATPLARVGTGAEVARAVLFLASDDASFITGHTLVVDGGLSA